MNAHSVVGVSHGGQGWHFACAHQRVELAAVVGPRLWQQVERGSKERLRWLASVNVKPCGEKTSVVKSARGSAMVVLSVGVFSNKSCWDPPHSRPLGTVVIPIIWLVLVAPVLLPYYY